MKKRTVECNHIPKCSQDPLKADLKKILYQNLTIHDFFSPDLIKDIEAVLNAVLNYDAVSLERLRPAQLDVRRGSESQTEV